MLNSSALAQLSTFPPTLATRALRILADHDLTSPRLLILPLLDQRYAWPEGTAGKVVARLTDGTSALLLVRSQSQLTRRDRSRGHRSERWLVEVAPEYLVSLREQAEQDTRLRQAEERERMVACRS